MPNKKKVQARLDKKREEKKTAYLNSKNADTKEETPESTSLEVNAEATPVVPFKKVEIPVYGIASHMNYRCTGISNGTSWAPTCDSWKTNLAYAN